MGTSNFRVGKCNFSRKRMGSWGNSERLPHWARLATVSSQANRVSKSTIGSISWFCSTWDGIDWLSHSLVASKCSSSAPLWPVLWKKHFCSLIKYFIQESMHGMLSWNVPPASAPTFVFPIKTWRPFLLSFKLGWLCGLTNRMRLNWHLKQNPGRLGNFCFCSPGSQPPHKEVLTVLLGETTWKEIQENDRTPWTFQS